MIDPAISSIIGSLIGALSSIIIVVLQNRKEKQHTPIIVPNGYKSHTPKNSRLWLIIVLSILIGGALGYGAGFVIPPPTATPETTDLPMISTTEAPPNTPEITITDTVTVTSPIPPTITATSTSVVLPDAYEVFDDFSSEGKIDDKKWNLTNASSECSEVQTGGYLLVQCNENAASGTVFRLTPVTESYRKITGVAMYAQFQKQVGDSGGKIHLIFRFSEHSYIISLRAVKVAVSEVNGGSNTLITKEVDPSILHLLLAEYDEIAGVLSFYLDGSFLVQANLSPGSKMISWSLEGEAQSPEKPRIEQVIIDWVAIKK
jgi:hypothetical protein